MKKLNPDSQWNKASNPVFFTHLQKWGWVASLRKGDVLLKSLDAYTFKEPNPIYKDNNLGSGFSSSFQKRLFLSPDSNLIFLIFWTSNGDTKNLI